MRTRLSICQKKARYPTRDAALEAAKDAPFALRPYACDPILRGPFAAFPKTTDPINRSFPCGIIAWRLTVNLGHLHIDKPAAQRLAYI